ncbi:hypothetical protein AB1L88_25835 [Tautonia sp. JC769]|uniref:hypothetical protein n=1 Tax=Tautonia sp. JC769 TaxID=3232135 RepID=UPI00345953CA
MHRAIRSILHRLRPIHPPCLMAAAVLYATIIGFMLWGSAGTDSQADTDSGHKPADGPWADVPAN